MAQSTPDDHEHADEDVRPEVLELAAELREKHRETYDQLADE